MTSAQFLVAPDVAGRAVASGSVTLDGREGHHAADVRRLKGGEPARVTDGHGLVLRCTVASVSRAEVHLRVEGAWRESRVAPLVTVAQALVKQDAAERALSAMTEVGVDAVLPFAAERSVVVWDDSRRVRGERRWRSTVAQASKQAGRAWVPEVHDVVRADALTDRLRQADRGLVLDPSASMALGDVDLDGLSDVVVVVGPEGGLSAAETDAMTAVGAWGVRLGPSVLRAATAGAVAAAVLLSRTPRWRTQPDRVPAG